MVRERERKGGGLTNRSDRSEPKGDGFTNRSDRSEPKGDSFTNRSDRSDRSHVSKRPISSRLEDRFSCYSSTYNTSFLKPLQNQNTLISLNNNDRELGLNPNMLTRAKSADLFRTTRPSRGTVHAMPKKIKPTPTR
jgi:hypothetical protein